MACHLSPRLPASHKAHRSCHYMAARARSVPRSGQKSMYAGTVLGTAPPCGNRGHLRPHPTKVPLAKTQTDAKQACI